MIKIYFIANVFLVSCVCAQLTGTNVCKTTETYSQIVQKTRKEPYQVREYIWCLNFPPRCSKYSIKFRNSFYNEVETKTRLVDTCCEGYNANATTNTCEPVCRGACLNGNCIAPNVCECWIGFQGEICDKECENGYYGKNCELKCSCLNNAVCDTKTGTCSCKPGFTGVNCETSCNNGTFGLNCGETCDCLNGASCDPVDGTCSCSAGYHGKKCESSCAEGNFGENCAKKCECKNGKCNHITGTCDCSPGWAGKSCQYWCGRGKFGKHCRSDCICKNEANCNPVTGFCTCTEGWTGPDCGTPCPEGKWGQNCKESCDCGNGGKCDYVTGICQLEFTGETDSQIGEVNQNGPKSACPDGWKGTNCTERKCGEQLWGLQCENICECKTENTKLCHPLTGSCECKDGWADKDCNRESHSGTFGRDCSELCLNNGKCTHEGKCVCPEGFAGDSCEKFVFNK